MKPNPIIDVIAERLRSPFLQIHFNPMGRELEFYFEDAEPEAVKVPARDREQFMEWEAEARRWWKRLLAAELRSK